MSIAPIESDFEPAGSERPVWPDVFRGVCMHHFVSAQAANSPAKTAVVCGDQSLTYGELELRAGALASELVRRGVTPETLVGICAQRSPDMIVAILGVLKSGGAYVPIDPAYPRERIQFMLEDSGCRLLLTQAHLRQSLPRHAAEVLCIEDHCRKGVPISGGTNESPDQLAYVIYTSGSTGKPKGTLITHRSLVYSTKARFDVYDRPLESYLLLSSFAFDSSVAGIFWTLCAGGKLVLTPEGVQQDPSRIVELIARERVSHLLCLPSLYSTLLDGAAEPNRGAGVSPASVVGEAHRARSRDERSNSVTAVPYPTAETGETPAPRMKAARHPASEAGGTPPRRHADGTILQSLNSVIVAGEACSVDLVARHHASLPHAELYNEYGPTEATVWSTVYRCKAGEKLESVPIGRPIAPETELLVLTDAPIGGEKIVCATGETGEVYIGGEGLARGYLNRPELTAERFVTHPFRPGARLYRTGDLARWLPSGDLEFIGRVDQQVKIRGYRIELGEIEAALGALPSVRECAVVARRGAVSAPSAVGNGTRLERGAGVSPVSAVGETHRAEARDENADSVEATRHIPEQAGETPAPRHARQTPALRDAGELRLFAYIVPNGTARLTTTELREQLSKRLPEYMLPSSFVFLDDFPRTPNGKIDRKALPEPTRKRPELSVAYVAPRNALEEYLCGIWRELLELDQVGVHDSFFEIGGTSLKGASFIARVQRDLGEFIYIVKLFESPTIAGFAEFLSRDYSRAVANRFGQTVVGVPMLKTHRKISEDMIAQMRRCIPTLPVEERGVVSAKSAVGGRAASERGAGVSPASVVGEARRAVTRDESVHFLEAAHNPTAETGETPAPRGGAAHNPTAETGETPAPRNGAAHNPTAETGETPTLRSVRRNPRAIFILSPPRSGTTLLRVMLAGHPQLFSATELQLLGFNTLQERRQAFSGKYSLWLEGTLRALMEIKKLDAESAKALMQQCEDRNLSTREFYALLQDWVAPRTLVDKSPSYVFDLETLKKAERDFEGALYIHLVRHPYAMVRSFEKLHMDQALYLHEHPFTARELGELLWVISHQNTLKFLESVPRERQFRMRFEDLTTAPRETLSGMCAQLGLEFHEEMAQPYKDVERKMTDGLYAQSTPMGDENFLKHGEIKRSVAEQWKDVLRDDFLSDITWELAQEFGYQREASAGEEQKPAVGNSRLAAQRRLRARERT